MKLICPECGNIIIIENSSTRYLKAVLAFIFSFALAFCLVLLIALIKKIHLTYFIGLLIWLPIWLPVYFLYVQNLLYPKLICSHCNETNLVELSSQEGIGIYNKFHNN